MSRVSEGFRYRPGQRPVGTSVTDGGVLHYTCNAPSEEVLASHGIGAVGASYGVAPREVVLMPLRLFRAYKRGQIGTVEAEQVLRALQPPRR